jgi:hypothetical protein
MSHIKTLNIPAIWKASRWDQETRQNISFEEPVLILDFVAQAGVYSDNPSYNQSSEIFAIVLSENGKLQQVGLYYLEIRSEDIKYYFPQF